MGPSLSAIHEALIADPSLFFVQLIDGKIVNGNLAWSRQAREVIHVYSGSFNPLHDGHKAIYEAADCRARHYGVFGSSYYELSINRFDKAPVTAEELGLRLQQFVGHAPVLITNVAKFSEKAGVFRGNHKIVFHVGADTITRLLAHSSSMEVAGLNCEFIYYERLMNGTRVEFPEKMPVNCHKGAKIPEELMGISSTAIRNAGKVLT